MRDGAELRVITLEDFPSGDVARAWGRLVDEDPASTVFHTARFLRLWCRHLRGDCDLRLRVVVAGPENRPVGIVPEVREPEQEAFRAPHASDGPGPVGARADDGGSDGRGSDRFRAPARQIGHFAGGYHVTDYLGPVSRPDMRGEVVDAWLGALAADAPWEAFVAGGLAEDAGWHELIADRAPHHGMIVTGPDLEDVCPRVDLTGGWDAYLDRLTGKQRHEIRRKARKLAREIGTVKLVEEDTDELDAAVKRFVELARTSPGDKGVFFDDQRARFFQALADEFGDDGTFRVHRLDLDGTTAAITVSLVHGDGDDREWGLYNSAFDRSFGNLAPGMVLVGELIRLAAEDGCATVDLLRGDEAYKYRFGATDRRLRSLVLTRPGDDHRDRSGDDS